MDFSKHLNERQLQAVTAPDGPVLVIAAAGTGKTRTLTHRVAWLAMEREIDPSQILLLTFTNRAAREMLDRAEQLVGGDVSRPWGGTFHHAANRILRRHAPLIGYGNDYTILDEDDSTRLMKSCIADLGLKDKQFPKPKVLSGIFGLAANREMPIDETIEASFGEHADCVDGVLQVHRLYGEKKRALNAMDFDDLLANGLKLLREHARVADSYRDRFLHVLVDEYQDTNKLQADFVDLIAGRRRNLMVVGDDFQSIYSWRGAEVQNMLSFEQRYEGALKITLEENYRSTPGILEVANQVIAGNPDQYQKVLRPTRAADVKPTMAKVTDGGHQARYVVDKVRQLLAAGAVRPSEVAVLYRSHYQALDLQLELVRAKLDHVVVSGVRFFEQAHVKDACTLPRLAVNPADSLAFGRLMELFPKVGPKRVQTMWKALGGHFNLRDAEKREQALSLLPKEAQPLWKGIVERIFPGGEDDGKVLDRPDELVFRFNEAFYDAYAKDEFENAKSRQDDIEELMRFSGSYKNTAEFLSEMALLTNMDAEQDKHKGQSSNAIRLTTIHQAKGLEWKAVFVLWLAEGMFPPTRSLEESGNLSEERRLFYVAVTRAKDYLWLCVPRMRRARDGGCQLCMPSRFIDEIDPALLQTDKPGGFSNVPKWTRW
jgi:DNA helicase II / ATP-dependent DNA helicase PcrA